MVSVAANASPAVIYNLSWSLFALTGGVLADFVIEESMVEPECVAEALHVIAVTVLLPVKPPKINSHVLQRVDYRVEICVSPVTVGDAETDRAFVAVLVNKAFRTVIIVCP